MWSHFIPGKADCSSSCPWSLGVNTEHSIANAYIDAIKNSKHYVYIENQVCDSPDILEQVLTP